VRRGIADDRGPCVGRLSELAAEDVTWLGAVDKGIRPGSSAHAAVWRAVWIGMLGYLAPESRSYTSHSRAS